MQALNELMAQAKPVVEKVRAYSTRAWGEIARLALPPPTWFLGQCFALGFGRVRLHAIFGQGGLGKSRISMNIARNQVLGLEAVLGTGDELVALGKGLTSEVIAGCAKLMTNLDLALAHHVERRLSETTRLEPRHWAMLAQRCRQLKETLLQSGFKL